MDTTTLPPAPERKRFNHITVSNLVSPVTSLFRTSKKTSHHPAVQPSEHGSLHGLRYDSFQSRIVPVGSLEKSMTKTFSLKNVERPLRPSIGVLLETFNDKGPNTGRLSHVEEDTTEKKEKLFEVALEEVHGFAPLSWTEFTLSREEFEKQTQTIENLKAKLKSEMRMRDGAATLVRAQTDKKLAKKARDQFESSERRVGQLSSEIWRLSQSANYIHQRLLEHTAVTLGRALQQNGNSISDFDSHRNSSIGDDAMSTLKIQLAAMSSKLDAIIDSKEGHTKPFMSGDTDSGVGHEHRSWYSLDHRKLWELEKDEAVHLLTEQVNSLQTELHQAQGKIVEYQRKGSSPEVDNPRVNELIRTSLKNAIVEKERYRIELEKEKSLRMDITRQMEELQSTISQNTVSSHEDRDKSVQTLRTKLEECIRDIDSLHEENEDIKDTLRQLFVLCPNYSPAHTYSDEDDEEKFTLDGFVNRVSYLIEENHHLMDRVLELQSENERHRAKIRKSRSDLESVYESPIPTPTVVQSRSWLEESSDDEYHT